PIRTPHNHPTTLTVIGDYGTCPQPVISPHFLGMSVETDPLDDGPLHHESLLLDYLVWAVFMALFHLHNLTAPMMIAVHHASSELRIVCKRLAPGRRRDCSSVIRSRLHRSDSGPDPLIALFSIASGDEQFSDLQQVTDPGFIVI